MCDTDSIFLKTDAGTERVRFAELVFVEGYGNFVKCHLASGRVLLTAETMKQMESKLPAGRFVCIHKSYLVNLTSVERVTGNVLLAEARGPWAVPTGRTCCGTGNSANSATYRNVMPSAAKASRVH